MKIELTKKELKYIIFALRHYGSMLGFDIKQDLFYKELFKQFENNIHECARIERGLFKKIMKKMKQK